MTDQTEDFERVQEARKLFRRGYAWIDALGSVGLPDTIFPYEAHVTAEDEAAHDSAWSA